MWIELTSVVLVGLAISIAAWRSIRARGQRDRQDLAKSSQVIEEQRRIMGLIARGASFQELLDSLTESIERIEPGTICTIMLLDQEVGRFLLKGSGPSLPPEYLAAINGLEIGPDVGACGSAAFRNETIVVEDVGTDYRFELHKEFVMSFGLRSCWSVPIRNSWNKVLGTFAMYRRQPAKPRQQELRLVEAAAHLAGNAIESLRTSIRLRETSERLDLAEKAAAFGIWEIDIAARVVTLSEGLAALIGMAAAPRRQLLDDLTAMIDPQDLEPIGAAVQQAAQTGDLRVEFRITLPNGSVRWVLVQGRARTESGELKRATGALIDITEERQMLLELQGARETAENAARNAREAESLEQDRKTILEMVAKDEPLERIAQMLAGAVGGHMPGCSVSIQLEQPGASRISVSIKVPQHLEKLIDRIGISSLRPTLIAKPIAQLASDPELQICANSRPDLSFGECGASEYAAVEYRAVPILQNASLRGMIIAISPRDRRGKDDEGKLLESWGQFASLGVERRALYEQLSFRAKYDSLTTLLNRTSLYEQMAERLCENTRQRLPLAVLYIDLDHFKEINDRHGHDAGDAVLRSAAARLLHLVRPEDLVARVGGDEFIVVLQEVGDRSDAWGRGEAIVDAISQPTIFNDHELRVGASCGISICPGDGLDTDTLLKLADRDMYRTKLSRKQAHRSAKTHALIAAGTTVN